MPQNPLIVFDLCGAYGMFRKFYTNSSSLSYPFPPRTTVAGLIAGMMGYERDEYAEDLGLERCHIALSVRVPVRRVMQQVNYLMTEGHVWTGGAGGFDGSKGPIQVPLEWIFPEVGYRELRYRIYVTHEDRRWLESLREVLESGAPVYPPYLGMSECPGRVEHVASTEDWSLGRRGEELPISTVLPASALSGPPRLGAGTQIVKERTPLALDERRRLIAAGDLLYNRAGPHITARLESEVFEVSYQESHEYGVFMQ
ncbi:type I-B CRISPR-associated protein Cas5 [Rubrobacter xylanophilus]|uniref:Type I-B CRISPR-associated protein Cas5 n=1 Tax=Rubrobacter xylanophilus TaxID=49319 RepID=A0A510HN39_9ACTN|nr:CRISPR-associated protein Cas5 [Rubrobacter xylanophilus]BBL80795.1 type I-B CRISPR-associated protein Cas5 [Rubrobacter xylanophilus]